MPGSLSDIQAYLPFNQFSDDFFVVLWDQRGQGLSERVGREELSFNSMVEEIAELKRIFSPSAPITLLGHSWSAVFAALYAGRYPNDVEKLVLMEPFGFSSKIMTQANAGVVNLMTPGYLDMAWFSTFMTLSDHERLDFRMRGMLTSGVRPFFKEPNKFPSWPVRRVGGLALLSWEAALFQNGRWEFDFSDEVARITAMVLLVGSEYSFIGYDFQKTWNEGLFQAATSRRTIKIPDSGHRMITENWPDLHNGIRLFLKDIP